MNEKRDPGRATRQQAGVSKHDHAQRHKQGACGEGLYILVQAVARPAHGAGHSDRHGAHAAWAFGADAGVSVQLALRSANAVAIVGRTRCFRAAADTTPIQTPCV